MKRLRPLIAFLVIVTFLVSSVTSCATIFHGESETIHVRSEEADTLFFANERDIGKGTTAVTSLPKKGLSKAVLRAEKAGCGTKSVPIPTEFDALSLLGILIDFGLISILVVDWAATGAVNKASQTDYVLTPECPKK